MNTTKNGGHVKDNLSEVYYSLTPYNYAGNTPVNTIDIDGNLFIFANGFMKNHWAAGKAWKSGAENRQTGERSGAPYVPDRGFYKDGPRNNGQTFKDYWEKVDVEYIKQFNDPNAYYTNGSFTPKATASARFSEGMKAAEDLIKKLEAGEITLADGETIKIVGHSQGAAFAAGIATELAKHDKYGSLLEFVDYLAPHQPGDFIHPNGVVGRQFSTKSDLVSSKWPIAKLFGNSKYAKIQGTKWGKERENYNGGMGGHMVGTWLNDLIDYWRSLGINITVHE